MVNLTNKTRMRSSLTEGEFLPNWNAPYEGAVALWPGCSCRRMAHGCVNTTLPLKYLTLLSSLGNVSFEVELDCLFLSFHCVAKIHKLWVRYIHNDKSRHSIIYDEFTWCGQVSPTVKADLPAIFLKSYSVLLSFPYPIRHIYVNVGAKIVDLVAHNLFKQTKQSISEK